MTTYIDTEKAFDKNPKPLQKKKRKKEKTQQIRNRKNFFNLVKGICEKHTANIKFNGERLDAFPPNSGKRQGYIFSTLLFSIVLEILTKAIRQEKYSKLSRLQRSKTVSIHQCHDFRFKKS